MDRNVCGVERVLRIVVALALLAVGYRNRDRTLGTLSFLAGSDLLATAVVGRCPANALLGISTCPGERAAVTSSGTRGRRRRRVRGR